LKNEFCIEKNYTFAHIYELGASGGQRGGNERETKLLEASNLTTARKGKTCEAVRAGRNNSFYMFNSNFFKKMTKSKFSLRNVVKIGVASLAVCVMFAACGKEESSDKKITAFSFATPQANGEIDEKAKTISVSVPNGTDVTALVPTISISEKATVSPASGVAQNFTDPVIYTVTAENGSTAEYTVTVKKGIGGGDDGLFKDAKFKLPQNVSIKYESYMDGDLLSSVFFVKIGNDIYRENNIPNTGIRHTYFKYNGTNWQKWDKMEAPAGWDWTLIGPRNVAEVIDEVGGAGGMLTFMTNESYYTNINGKTKNGTEKVAGVTCDKYVLASRTLYHDPVSNLFLKAESSTTLSVVTEWKTSVTSFGDINLP